MFFFFLKVILCNALTANFLWNVTDRFQIDFNFESVEQSVILYYVFDNLITMNFFQMTKND